MTKENLIEIARVGFRGIDWINIDYSKCEISESRGIYRLYKPKKSPDSPNVVYLVITLLTGEVPYVKMDAGLGHRGFNHYAAIRKMEELGVVECKSMAPYEVRKEIALQDLLEIARAGFSDWEQQSINFGACDIWHDDHRVSLYDKRKGISPLSRTPKKIYLSLFMPSAALLGVDGFIQIEVNEKKEFNHYAAIKKMEELHLVSLSKERI